MNKQINSIFLLLSCLILSVVYKEFNTGPIKSPLIELELVGDLFHAQRK